VKKVLFGLIASVAFIGCSKAETFIIDVEYTLPAGASWLWIEAGTGGCAAAKKAGPYGGCSTIPTGQTVKQCTGTVTIKIPNVEMLHRIICGNPGSAYPAYSTIWEGHMVSTVPPWSEGGVTQAPGVNTVRFQTPILLKRNGAPQDPLITGPNACWSEYGAYNYGASSPNGGGFEVQGVCSTE
jgi:hypothetical protein